MRLFKVAVIVCGAFAAAQSDASPLSISSGSNPFIPTDVIDQVSQSDVQQKLKFCVGDSERIFGQLQKLSEQPPLKLEGYNSRMDNRDDVIGAEQLDLFVLRMSEAYTDAWMTSDTSKKERLLDYLAKWAKSGALLDTYNCMSKGYYDGLGECAEWRQKDGQDLSKAKDFGTAQISMMHLAYGYYLLLSDFNSEDSRHLSIQKWFKQFFQRNPIKTDVYFGMDLGWNWPNVVYGRLIGAGNFSKNNPDKLLKRAVKKLDSLINDDGSLVNRTTRGNRALWYHLTGLNETLITFEMARAAGIEISTDLDTRIQKAGEIFIRGFEDHSYMDRWAKEAYNSIYVPGEQIFNGSFDTPNGNAAMFIFMYRYPESEPAKKIAQYLSHKPNAGRMDAYIGFGMGCFYAAAKDNRDGPWVDQNFINENLLGNASQEKTQSRFVSRPLQFETAFPTGSYSERNYKDVKITVINVSIDEGSYLIPRLKFSLMFDFDSSSQTKPTFVRIQLEKDQLTEVPKRGSLDECHKATFKKDSTGLQKVRLVLGDDSVRKNDCLLASLSQSDRSLLLGIAESLPEIIATGSSSEFGKQAAELLKAYSKDYEKLPEVGERRTIRTDNLKLNTSKADACLDPVFAKMMGQACD